MKRILVFLLLLFSSTFFLYSQGAPDTERIDKLENEVISLKNALALYTKFYDEQKTLIEDRNNLILILLTVGGSIGIGIILTSVTILFKNFKTLTEKKIETKLSKIVSEKREIIKKIIKDEEFEEKVKLTRKILIIGNPDNNSRQELIDLFHKYRFQNHDYKMISDKIDCNKYDLILFDDYKKNLPTAEVNKIIARAEDKAILYFYYNHKAGIDENGKNINYANRFNTIYPRIMEVIQYMDTMKE